MKIYIRCCIDTDQYEIKNFKKGAKIMVSPMGPSGALPFVETQAQIKKIDEMTNSIQLNNSPMDKIEE